jgi:hypothetical protein
MKFTISIESNIDTNGAAAKIMAAAKAALQDIVIDTVQEAKNNSPVSGMWPSIDKSGRVPTGNNKRSINFEMGPGGDSNLDEMQGAVFSTSGYGGFLETGTRFTPARPYLYPAAMKNFTKEKFDKRLKEHLGESQ